MDIAIIGAGNVGGTLGTRWAQGGHRVTFCSRNPDGHKVRILLESAGPNARAASIGDGVRSADVVLLAPPWPAVAEAIEAAGDLEGKVLVDCTNPVEPDFAGVTVGHTTSAAEQIAVLADGARVVKAFNTIHAKTMEDPVFGEVRADLHICGDDPDAKHVVKRLGEELGFDVVDAGPLSSARFLEPMALLWMRLAFKQDWGVDFAFKAIRR
ncbi:MAG: NADPH-dependent F420 reductase [Planctomycetota bacterium]|jgi:predicted dinucleotide-binding enzyme